MLIVVKVRESKEIYCSSESFVNVSKITVHSIKGKVKLPKTKLRTETLLCVELR